MPDVQRQFNWCFPRTHREKFISEFACSLKIMKTEVTILLFDMYLQSYENESFKGINLLLMHSIINAAIVIAIFINSLSSSSPWFYYQPKVSIVIQGPEERDLNDRSDTCSVKSSTSGVSDVSGYSTTSDASRVRFIAFLCKFKDEKSHIKVIWLLFRRFIFSLILLISRN